MRAGAHVVLALAGSRPRRRSDRPPCGARGDLGAGPAALRAGLGAILRACGRGGEGRPAPRGPRPVRGSLNFAVGRRSPPWPGLRCTGQRSSLRDAEITGLTQKTQWQGPVLRRGSLPDFGNWGVNLSTSANFFPEARPRAVGCCCLPRVGQTRLVICLDSRLLVHTSVLTRTSFVQTQEDQTEGFQGKRYTASLPSRSFCSGNSFFLLAPLSAVY